MFCTKCGKENKSDVNFCAYCGVAIGREQASTSNRGVAAKCSVCGKQMSPSEVRFAPSTGLKPCCPGCVGGTVSKIDTSEEDLEAKIRVWTPAQFADQAEKGRRLEEAKQATLEAMGSGPPFDLGRIYRATAEYLLAMRVFRDGYTGETTATEPMPDVTTEAGMTQATRELEEFQSFQEKQSEMLGRIIAEKTERTRGQREPGQPELPKPLVDFILESRRVRDSITGESTLVTRPSPYLMTQAEMVEEINEFKPIMEKENQRLEKLKGDQQH